MTIKNIVFDVGNVLVKWAPYDVINMVFPGIDPKELFKQIRPIWLDLNLGKISEKEAVILYNTKLNLPVDKTTRFFYESKKYQTPIEGSIELLEKLKKLRMNLYSITDNIKEYIEYHKKHSIFPQYFKDIIVSADIGVLKPDKRIYQYLLDKHNLDPAESVFIDDVMVNVEGALSVGMKSFQFIDTKFCVKELIKLGINL